MKKLLLINLLLGIGIGLSAQNTTLVLKASRDVSLGYHDNYNSANRNYGDAPQSAAYYIPGFIGGINCNRAIIDFDLSGVPSQAVINEAILSLYAYKDYPKGTMGENGHFGNNSSYLRRVISGWDEFTATWNTQPETTTKNQVILHKSNHADENYTHINVTALVIDMINNPGHGNGFLLGLMQENEYANLSFYSKEGADTSKHPVLKIIYQTKPEDPQTPSEPEDPQTPSEPTDPQTPGEGDNALAPQDPIKPDDPKNFDFIIYPNPGKYILKIEFKSQESKNILMYTLEGKILFSINSDELIYPILVRDLSPGVYFLQCSNGDRTITRKYVKLAH